MKTEPAPVRSEVYDRSYYLEHMEGADAFARSQGDEISPRLAFALGLAALWPAARTLDLGCGRGELAWQCARQGANSHGLDYAWAALEIARGLRTKSLAGGLRLQLEQASAYALPYATNSFDAVFMLDIVEHLQPTELLATLREVRRVLQPAGRLIIHTMPNADYYRWGYPVYRLLMRALGYTLPGDPRKRWYRGETHVNIQSPARLRRTLAEAGFKSVRVWLQPISRGRWQRLTGLPLVRAGLCNDILALASKQ